GTDATADHHYFVDANNGNVVWHYDALPQDAIGKGEYSGLVSFPTLFESNVYRLQDLVRGANPSVPQYHGDFTADMRHQTSCNPLENCIETDADNTWG